MLDSLTYSGNLTVVVCWCGMRHAVPEELRNFQRRQFDNGEIMESIYCPLGHPHQPAGKTKSEKLQEDLDQKERVLQRERQAHDQTRADRDHKENQRRGEKAAKTKLQNRAKNGVCPCCNRTFRNLQRHMTTKHPGFASGDE